MTGAPLKVAVVGSGISGLAVAHTLQGQAQVTLFEAADYFGGHTHTVDITLPTPQGPVTHGVDTGFLVYNERTYPNLINLFAELGVHTSASEMSFSVQVPGAGKQGAALEWSGNSLSTVFAQRSNLGNLRFWHMLADVLRFNALATRLATRLATNLASTPDDGPSDAALMQPLGAFLQKHRFGDAFRDWYFLPMLGCIWSCPTAQMLQFPVATMLRFCHNHGLVQITNRPQWYTVTGGARHYVDAIVGKLSDARLNSPVRQVLRDADGVRIVTDGRVEHFDKVVMATHSDQALALLQDTSAAERATLGALRYQDNHAVLHTDASVLPQLDTAWAAWNYSAHRDHRDLTGHGDRSDPAMPRVCLHYLINRLQPLPFKQPVIVSLNPIQTIAPGTIHGEFSYAHPVFDVAAIRAQADVPALQGQQHTYFAGAWMGYGFHEDGLKAGLGVARLLLKEAARRNPGTPS
jgi:uncharacterized protein